MRMIRTAAALALTSLCAIAHSADLVVVNAKVTTLDEHRPTASAFAIKSGKFVAVGEEAEVRKLEVRWHENDRCRRPDRHSRPERFTSPRGARRTFL